MLQVYQRQIMKSDLAGATMLSGNSVGGLSHNELKQLFNLDKSAECATKELLEKAGAGGSVAWLKLPAADSSSSGSGGAGDDSSLPSAALAAAVAAGAVTAINRERQPGDAAEQEVAPADAGAEERAAAAAAATAGPPCAGGAKQQGLAARPQQGSARAGAVGVVDDVDELEVCDDDGW